MDNKMKQLFYGFGLYEEYWLIRDKMAIQVWTGYKKDDGTIDEYSDDYDKIREIFSDIPDKIEVGSAEAMHFFIGNETKEVMRTLIKHRLERHGYIHNPEWDDTEEE